MLKPSMSMLVRASQSMVTLGWINHELLGLPGILGFPLVLWRFDKPLFGFPTVARAFVVDVVDTNAFVIDQKGNHIPAWKAIAQIIGPASPPEEVEVTIMPQGVPWRLSAQQLLQCPVTVKSVWVMKRMPDDANFPDPSVPVLGVLDGPLQPREPLNGIVVQSYLTPGTRTLQRAIPLAEDVGEILAVQTTYQKFFGRESTLYGWLLPIRKDGQGAFPRFTTMNAVDKIEESIYP